MTLHTHGYPNKIILNVRQRETFYCFTESECYKVNVNERLAVHVECNHDRWNDVVSGDMAAAGKKRKDVLIRFYKVPLLLKFARNHEAPVRVYCKVVFK
jgi:hypothetical protein